MTRVQTGEYLNCHICNKLFYCTNKKIATKKYCSYPCYYKSKIGTKLTKEHRKKISAGNLGKTMSREAKEKIRKGLMGNKNTLGRKQSESEREKRRINNAGHFKVGSISCFRGKYRPNISLENHGMWEGGKSFKPYPLKFNNRLKEMIRTRDMRGCRLCYLKENNLEKRMCVHHIDYNKENIKTVNLISLCNSCHARTITQKNYWKIFYQSINRYLKENIE